MSALEIAGYVYSYLLVGLMLAVYACAYSWKLKEPVGAWQALVIVLLGPALAPVLIAVVTVIAFINWAIQQLEKDGVL
ncbi:MAG TPA: hypothetical protein VF765_31265 [Polyangiaceae bacterium]